MKTITIEELLHWAFVHELSKGGGINGLENGSSVWRQMNGSSWGLVSDYAELHTCIDRDRTSPGMWFEQGAPHDDALEVAQAVKDLANLDVVIPDAWAPLADWPETYGLADIAIEHAVNRYQLRSPQARRTHLVGLVISSAVLNRAPDFDAPVPEMQKFTKHGQPMWFVKENYEDAFGRTMTIEVDGYNQKSKRPLKGAYQKYEFLTDPVADVMGRIDYQVWVAAMKYLESNLMGRLVDHRLVYSELAITPWVDGVDGAGVGLIPAGEYGSTKKIA